MSRRLLPLIALMFLAGCAGTTSVPVDRSPRSNLEPEIAGLEALSQSRGRPLSSAERQALASRPEIKFRLTNEENEEVRLFFQYYARDKRGSTQRWLMRGETHLEYVRAVLASHRLPQDLMALPFIESGYNVMAVSSSGAVGMWQFMPATAQRFGLTVDWWLDERRDPYLATVAAARYLEALYKQFGDWQLALAAYNAGEGSISRAMTRTGKQSFNSLAKSGPLRDETRHYVPRFLAMLKILQNSKKLGFTPPSMHASKDLQEVRVPGGSDLAGMADAMNLSWDQFHALNPAYRRKVSPPDRSTAAWVPKHLVRTAQAYLSRPGGSGSSPAVRMASFGDTWWSLSRDTGVPAATLREANKGANTPASGRPVLIPVAACSLDAAAPEQRHEKPAPRATTATAVARNDGAAMLYIVRHGDTLSSVAQKAGVSVQDLADFNKANPNEPLLPGTPLIIPQAGQSVSQAKPVAYKVVKR